jgi:cytohesin
MGQIRMGVWVVVMSGSLGAGQSQEADAPLKLAARAGDAASVTRLLATGAAVNQVDSGGHSALISAAFHGRSEVVRLLLKAGADPALKAQSTYAALDYAMERGHREVVIALLQHWLRVAEAEGKSEEVASLALTLAATEGREGEVDRGLARGAKPDFANRSGYGALPMAARWGGLGSVKRLLAAGAKADLPTRSCYHATPLMESTRDGRTDIARLLLAAGAPVNQPDRYGDHALNWAVFFGHLELVTLLVEKGSRLDITGQTPDTALAIAIREKHDPIVAFLKAAGGR